MGTKTRNEKEKAMELMIAAQPAGLSMYYLLREKGQEIVTTIYWEKG